MPITGATITINRETKKIVSSQYGEIEYFDSCVDCGTSIDDDRRRAAARHGSPCKRCRECSKKARRDWINR